MVREKTGLEGDPCIFLFLDHGTDAAAAAACRCLLLLLLLLRLCRCCS